MTRGTIAGLLLAFLAWGRSGLAQPASPDPIRSASAATLDATGRVAVAARVADARRLRERLGLSPAYDGVRGVDTLRIAVLDYGFEGVGGGRRYLPETAVVVEHYDLEFVRRNGLGDPEYRKAFEPGNRHGRDMAQIVWAVTGSRPGGPKFFLLNANGPTMLRRAIRYAVEQGVDILLFSGSFEGGGDGDGRGPVDGVVDEAVARGILWVNAAGNYGGRVLNAPVRVLKDGYLRLRSGSDVASARFRNRVDENNVTVTLTWNDYRGREDAGTDKDLDLFVEDWTGRVIGSGEKRQVSGDASPGPGPEESRNPRERVVLADLAASPNVATDPDYCYRVRVRAKRGAFAATDRLRLLVTAGRETYIPPGSLVPEETVTLLDATGSGELYPPADHPGVLTVGDGGPASSVGPTADGRAKPDAVVEDSRADFTDGQVTAGSSNAAAFLAGVAAVLKAAEPALRPADVLRLARECPVVARPPRPGLRAWQTPTRARLAEVARGAR